MRLPLAKIFCATSLERESASADSKYRMIDRTAFTWSWVDMPCWPQVQKELVDAYQLGQLMKRSWVWDDYPEMRQFLPTLYQWCDQQAIKPRRFASVQQHANTHQSYHVDLGPFDIALQLPVYGCELGYTGFYTSTEQRDLLTGPKVKTGNHAWFNYAQNTLTEIDRYYLTGPMMINIRQIHSVQNWSPVTRMGLSVRFWQDPWHLVDK